MNDRPPLLRRVGLPLAVVLGTTGILSYAALSRRDRGDDVVTLEPEARPAPSNAPTGFSERAARAIAAVAPRASSSAKAIPSSAGAGAGDAGPPPSPLCAAIAATNDALAADAGTTPLAPELKGGCFATPNGAWALRVDAWSRKGVWAGMDEYAGSWTLVHVDRAGHEVTGKPGGAEIYGLAGPIDNERVDTIRLFDYDNDGEPEVLIETHQRGHEDAVYQRAVVATFVGGAIRELAGLPKKYGGFEDVDKDGRPDVLWYPYGYVRAGALGDVSENGPTFVAHSLLDGRFSLDDAVAKATAERACPKAPADAGLDAAHAEVCALLRGATPAAARAVLEKECKRPDFDAGDSPDNPPAGVCFDFAEREGVLGVPPPLQLPP